MNRDVKVGDKIAVTMVNYDELERVHFAEVTGAYDDFDGGISIEPSINEEDILYFDQDRGDKWGVLLEEPQYDEEETLQHRQSHAYYDDEALSPSYSDAVKAGMTFAEYTGANITAESLDFEPKEEEVLRGITAESLNFEEAPEPDAVNHPSHYNATNIEVIDKLEDLASKYDDPVEAYLVSTAAKYLERAPFKGNKAQDIAKAIWYLSRLHERMEGE